MKIIAFNRLNGIYKFDLEEIKTESHAHPAIEILFSENGEMNIEVADSSFKNVSFAIIDSNIAHKVNMEKEKIHIVMVECHYNFLQKLLAQFDIELSNGTYIESNKVDRRALIEGIYLLCKQRKNSPTSNTRIQKCLDYLNSHSSDYKTMIETLKGELNLSESRISHLFKEETGLSIKKYLVWSRLKKAFEIVISGETNMYKASIQSGFYDQAHLSKAFKRILGLNPSEIYNSRTLQN